MADDNRDIVLKDGDIYLYPLAREDDTGRVIRDTYLTKTGEDSYICDATVETYYDPELKIEVSVLKLTNKNDPENPIKFVGGDGGFATWGFIKGEINDQGDLITTIDRTVEIGLTQKNKIFRQDSIPENTSEYALQNGDMWYVTGEVEGYLLGRWYVYELNEATGEGLWVLTADSEIAVNSSKITLTNEKIETEVTERKGADATLSSKITQTATGIKLEVGQTRTRYTEPKDEPPTSTVEQPIYPGDLWYCSDGSKGYTAEAWYIYEDGAWRPATEEETKTVESKIEQTAEAITSEVTRATEAEGELRSRITQTAESIMTEVRKKTSVVESDTAPADPSVGDIWHYTGTSTESFINGRYYRWDGTAWVLSEDSQVATNKTNITQNANAIVAEASSRVDEDNKLSGRITVNANSITSEVTRATTAEGELGTRITQTADSITAEVTRATEAEGNLSTRITQNANSITSEVTRATEAEGTLSTKIEQTESTLTATIQGVDDKYSVVKQTVDGWSITTAGGTTEINGAKIKTGTITSEKITTGTLTANTLQLTEAQRANWANALGLMTDENNKVSNLYSTNLLANNISGNTITCTQPYGVHTGGDLVLRQYGSGLEPIGQATLSPYSVTLLDGTSATWTNIINGSTLNTYVKTISKSTDGTTLTITQITNGSTSTITYAPVAVFG